MAVVGSSLQDLVRMRQRFARSANVERDAEGDAVGGYLPTARALDVVDRAAAAILDPAVGRAISVTGPYGSGKSSLALFLAALLGPATEVARRHADEVLREANPALALRVARARDASGAGRKGFIRAAVTAQREPIAATLLRALRVGVTRYAGGEIAASAEPALGAMLQADPALHRSTSELRHLVEGVATVAPVLLVIDEFGKSLEYVASSTAGNGADDLYLLQDLAEWSAGNAPLPLIIVTLQHLALEDYMSGVSVVQRREWSKVLGRFVDMPYVETSAQAQALVASVFEQTTQANLRRRLDAWAKVVRRDIDDAGLASELHVDPAKCYPLHPVTLATLPDLCARYGQNERTLFSFLAGSEPLSVRVYLSDTHLEDSGVLPSVRLDRVYDYFLESASTMVGASATASRWLEIETRIRDVHGLSAAEQRVLKTIGVLNLVSAGGVLRASRSLVAVAAADGQKSTATRSEVESVITALEAKGLVTYRGFADELRIWNGTDFDLKGAVELARRRLRDEPIAALLQRVRPLLPVVAARHSQETGTLRIFERQYADSMTTDISPLPASSSADGLVLLCVDPDGILPAGVLASKGDKPVIAGFTDAASVIVAAARELAAHLDILNTAADIQSDHVARRELRERAATAAHALDTALDRAFGPANRAVRWVLLPEDGTLPPSSGLSGVLSRLCDELYPSAPQFRNEMLARRDLTSQGARARSDLLTAMVERGDQERLGIEGYGPERAMFEAVLRRTGVHRRVDGTWRFGPPDDTNELSFKPVWSAIESVFEEAIERQVGVAELHERLMAPPYGLKDGPIPVLVTAALLARSDDVALYEEGTFVTRLTAEVVERLARNPDRFTIKGFATRTARGQVLGAIGEALQFDPRPAARARVGSVVSIASPLLARARNLPDYAKRTKEITDVARAVRDALFAAREPDELLFSALPSALGLAPFGPHVALAEEAATNYATALAAAMAEIGGIYPSLLNHIERSLANALGARLEVVREDLRVRAARLAGQILETQLRSFALALSDEALDRDEWVSYIAMLVANKPPASWVDDDKARFDQRCRQLGEVFRRVESLHFSQSSIPEDGFDAARVSVTLPDGTDAARVVWVDKSDEEAVSTLLTDMLARATQALGDRGAEMLLAKLAKRILLPEEQNVPNISAHDPSEGRRRQADA
jgi:energy-coupling factor transporter ATP-binding protein EcfA2